MKANVVAVLGERGLLEAVTSEQVRGAVESPVVVYAGFDPSAPSLQVGNLVAILGLAHFQRCGHRPIALVGGATGRIGDPSGKTSEREMIGPEQIARNVEGIRENLSRFLDFDDAAAPAQIVNNDDWLGRVPLIEFLRDTGRHFRMGAMLGRESVRARLESEGGMSFAEFSYPLLQARDFLHLYDARGCTVQIGGSDQWGNITAGVDLVRRLRGAEVYGLTLPLACDSSGQKLGKSEGNAVFLDRGRTSYYDFYQYFVRVADADAARLLRMFTFLPLPEIGELEEQVRVAPERRAAQKRLAQEVTRLVHGERGLRVAERASAVLFGEAMDGLRADELLEIFANVPSAQMPLDRVQGAAVSELAAAAGLCRSKGEARRLIESGGLYLNNRRVQGVEARVGTADLVEGRLLVLRSGKKAFHLVKVA
jgi:tyrosyl-tRNA synthetase